jgi:hypothetical protein
MSTALNAFKHGFAIRDKSNRRETIYLSWVGMRQRCNNSNNPDYRYYGGRGIRHCKRWNTFDGFFKDMGKAYYQFKKQYGEATLDRVDVNKDYSPSNCKWSTRREQSNNRNYNRLITYKGKKQSAGKWVVELSLPITARNLYKRIFTRGWDVERAMTQPLRIF